MIISLKYGVKVCVCVCVYGSVFSNLICVIFYDVYRFQIFCYKFVALW